MKPFPLLLAAALAALPAALPAADLGAPSVAVYEAAVMPQLWGATLLPRYMAEQPGVWHSMRNRTDSRGVAFVDFLDASGRIAASLCPAVLVGEADGVCEIRRANTAFYKAAGADGSVVVRIRCGTGAFGVTEGEVTPRPECPSIPATVALVSLP